MMKAVRSIFPDPVSASSPSMLANDYRVCTRIGAASKSVTFDPSHHQCSDFIRNPNSERFFYITSLSQKCNIVEQINASIRHSQFEQTIEQVWQEESNH